MSIPENLLYSKSHEWAKVENGEATVGITFFAQDALGDITYVDLPSVGDNLEVDGDCGAVESVKAASDLYSPVAGEVIAVNEELNAAPALVNQDPYGKGWMFKVKLAGNPEGLLDAAAYKAHCESEAH